MKIFSQQAFISVKNDSYLHLLMVIAPILNFLSGLTLTLYTASLPAIAAYFNSSMMVVKNMVSVSMLGFALGCIVFGITLDTIGRRIVILWALSLYIIASLLALVAQHIDEIIVIFFMQSMMAASVSIGPRALISDHFSGHRFQIGLLYTSLAYGLGSIIGPFAGGMLQYHFAWQANFLAYALSASVLLFIFAAFIHESLPAKPAFSFKRIAVTHLSMLIKGGFIAGAIIAAACQFELMVYPAAGAFIVENVLHRTAISYGNSALMISLSYMLGTFSNRALIKRLSLHQRTCFGFGLLVLSLLLQLTFAIAGTFNMLTLSLPIMIIAFSNGFIFMNVFGPSIKMFSNNTGIAMAVFTCLVMLLAAIGTFTISEIAVSNLLILALFFAIPMLIQFVIYFGFYKKWMHTI